MSVAATTQLSIAIIVAALAACAGGGPIVVITIVTLTAGALHLRATNQKSIKLQDAKRAAAATTIQAYLRRLFARNELAAKRDLLVYTTAHLAATIMQRFARGFRARAAARWQRVANIVRAVNSIAEYRQGLAQYRLDDASARIQAVVRGRITRAYVLPLFTLRILHVSSFYLRILFNAPTFTAFMFNRTTNEQFPPEVLAQINPSHRERQPPHAGTTGASVAARSSKKKASNAKKKRLRLEHEAKLEAEAKRREMRRQMRVLEWPLPRGPRDTRWELYAVPFNASQDEVQQIVARFDPAMAVHRRFADEYRVLLGIQPGPDDSEEESGPDGEFDAC